MRDQSKEKAMENVTIVTKKINWKPLGQTIAKLMLATLAGYAAQSLANKAFDAVVKVDEDEIQEVN
jgi:hypothetical protein